MKLSVGKIAFPIEFDNGDKDVIYFNPNDPDLGTRLINSKNRIEERIKNIKLEEIKLNNNGDVELPENIKDVSDLTPEQIDLLAKKAEQMSSIMEETKTIIYEELNAAFDNDISTIVFKHCSPFAIVNGQYFIEQFLNAITPEIQKHISKANIDFEKKMSKYANKYKYIK